MADKLEQLKEGFIKAGVPAGPALMNYLEHGEKGPPSEAKLLLWDTAGIKTFVFDTANAMVIRGASVILKELDNALKDGQALGIAKQQILFVGAGGGMAIVTEEQAKKAREKLQKRFADETVISTVLVETVALDADEKNFDDRVRVVNRNLAKKRALLGVDPESAVPMFIARCAVCGRRGVAIQAPRDRGDRPECAPCYRRLSVGQRMIKKENETRDYEEISDGRGYIAVLYADGNRFGKIFGQLKSPLEYCLFSSAVDEVFSNAVSRAAKACDLSLTKNDRDAKGYFQLPIQAGDDVAAILPGDRGIAFALSFLKAVEQGFDEQAETGHPILRDLLGLVQVGAGAGVAIGKWTYPVRHLVNEAEALMDRAKKLVYSENVRSALDFSVVRDGTVRAGDEDLPRFEDQPPQLLMSGRPYAVEEMDIFLHRFDTIRKHLKRTQRHALIRFAEDGPAQLRNHILFQIGRFENWRELIEELSGETPGLSADRDVEQILYRYRKEKKKEKVFDLADMQMIDRFWPEKEVRP